MSHFAKVSFEQFEKDCIKLGYNFDADQLGQIYSNIKLPSRGSIDSAGYDFFAPFDLSFEGIKVIDNQNTGHMNEYDIEYNYITLPTGIRWVADDTFERDLVLLCVPRSGQGFKVGLSLKNTMGVIDSGYCRSDNEGHIMAKITTQTALEIPQGKAFMQGIITKYYTTDNDNVTAIRNGGFGSTNQ